MEKKELTLGLLRGLVDRPEDAPLMDLDLHTYAHEHTMTSTVFNIAWVEQKPLYMLC